MDRHGGFNTQPPEGGWAGKKSWLAKKYGFNTQPPEGGWYRRCREQDRERMFQHTAARRRLVP